MAKNFLYNGRHVNIKNLSAAVASGNLCRQRGWLGIPMTHGAAGASITFAIEGIWGMTYSDYAGLVATISVGTILYWDTSTAKLSIGYANDDFAAVKVTDVGTLTTDGAFEGLLLGAANSKPVGQEQA